MKKIKLKVCKYCFWKARKGIYSSCTRKLPNYIPESQALKYQFLLVEEYKNKSCYNFLDVSYEHKKKEQRWKKKSKG